MKFQSFSIFQDIQYKKMDFSCTVTINAPRDKVVDIFQDPTKMRHWQDGFISKTLISGNEMQEGAESRMLYEFGKKDMTIFETILSNNLPDSFEGRYEHSNTSNTMKSEFKELDPNTTLYTAHIHYTRFTGFMVRLIAKLAPSMFKKQVQKWLDQFKDYVESLE